MSKFLTELKEFEKLKLIPKSIVISHTVRYNKANEDHKALYDKHAETLLKFETESRELNNLRSIKKNMQFLAWVMIVNLLGILYFLITNT